jgi:aryl-alcohol dehydrogenase-like predicted oxidoreductase
MPAEAHFLAKMHNLAPFISAQNQYSLLDRGVERELVPACKKYGVGILPFFPLASGQLTGKYRRGQDAPAGTRLSAGPFGARMLTEGNFDKVEKLEQYASGHGHTILELAMSWLASKPEIGSVIAGATQPDQVVANASAAEWRLTPEEMAEVDAL